MKKLLVWAMMLMIGFGFVTEAAAIEETVFGPYLIKKEKGKAKPEHFTFPATINIDDNCTLFVQPYQGNKVKAEITLNGVKVVSRQDKFVNGEIRVPVNLLDTNEIDIIVSGKTGAAAGVGIKVISPPPTTLTMGCGVITEDFTLITDANVTLSFLDGTSESKLTGVDGFCAFYGLPVEGAAMVSAVTPLGLVGSRIVRFSTYKEILTVPIIVKAPGPGSVSGKVETREGMGHEAFVEVDFLKSGYKAATKADANGDFVLDDLPLDGLCTVKSTPGNAGVTEDVTDYQPNKTVILRDPSWPPRACKRHTD